MHRLRSVAIVLVPFALFACAKVKGLVKVDTGMGVKSSSSSGSGSGSSSGSNSGSSGSGSSSSGSSSSSSSSDDGEAKPMGKGEGAVWCEGYVPSQHDSNASWARSYVESDGMSNKTLGYMAKAMCDKPKDAERQKEFTAWKQLYLDQFLATEADFVEAMQLYMKEGDAFEAEHKGMCGSLTVASDAAPEEKIAVSIKRFAVQCDGNLPSEGLWYLDKPTLTEVERGALVEGCIASSNSSSQINSAFAFCLEDMRKLDRARLDKEVAAMKLNLFGRVSLRERWGSAKAKATKLLAEYDALAKKDADWKRLIFEAPAKGWKTWMDAYTANKAAFEAVRKFEDKVRLGSKKALVGCGPELQKLFLDHLRAGKPASADEAKALGNDTVGYPLIVALMTCDAAEGRYLEVTTANTLFVESARRKPRGPRYAAYAAALTTLNDIRADKERFPLGQLGYLPDGPRTAYEAYEQTFNKISHDNAEGQVEGVKDNGDGTVTVTFKEVKWKEPVYKCKRTNRISRIDSDGNLIYEENCKQTGTENRSSKESPVVMAKVFAAGLKPGQMAAMAIDRKGDKRIGLPVGVYGDTEKKQFLGFYGVIW